MKWGLKRILIPHEGNAFRPQILRFNVVVPVIVFLIFLQIVLWWGVTAMIPSSRLFGIIEANALTDGTNQARAAESVSVLRFSPILQAAAQKKADDMATKGYFAHTSPDGITPWYWFGAVGYGYAYAGENLAVNFSNSADVTTAWLNSPEHRANILDPHFTEIGIATAQGTYQGHAATYVVELFGSPAAYAASQIAGIPTVFAKNLPLVPVASAAKPKPSKISAPPAVAVVRANATDTEPIAVAIRGAQSQGASATPSPAVMFTTSPATATAQAVPVAVAAAPETNMIQRAFANPSRTLDNFYYLVLCFFLFALGLNIFIKIRIQHPDLILGGLAAIAVAGIFILVNQHVIAQAVIK